jgi:CHAD domain-containing protein
LARKRISKNAYHRQTELLRKAADRLAPTRDADVKGAALEELSRDVQDQLGRGALRKLRQRLEGDLVRAEKRFERKKGASKVKRLLKQIPKELDCLRFEGKGWSALSPGVKAAFSRGRQAYLLANQNPSVGNLHEWRKRVKDLWYQVCVLRPIYPEHMDALAAQLKALSEYLGDDHDLVMLRESVQTDAGVQRELFEPAVLNDLIEQRRRELVSAALQTGGQIYAPKTSAFCGRLAQYWEAWRDGRKPGKRNQQTDGTPAR